MTHTDASLPVLTVSAASIGRGNNATTAVVAALSKLENGGTLRFEKGEYHFYEDGTLKRFYAVSNNDAGEKRIVLPLLQKQSVTVDGCGSTFVFHGRIFPFVADACRGLTLKNMILDRSQPIFVKMRVRDVDDQGFGLEIGEGECPFRIEQGSLIFQREWGEFSGLERKLSLHSADRFRVRYLFTGACEDSKQNLPVSYMSADAVRTEWGVRLTYRKDPEASDCLFWEGESLYVVLDGERENDLIFLNECEDVRVENITVRAAMGMGIIGQLCRDIRIKNFCSDSSRYAGGITVSADAMHFVNCDGVLDISDCRITHTGDDILNVHGMYTLLREARPDRITAQIMHRDQYFFCPYRPGDRLVLIQKSTMKQLAVFLVSDYSVSGALGTDITLNGRFEEGFGELSGKGDILIENPDRMPDLHLWNCYFSNYPHLRISGSGKMLVENTVFENSRSAVHLLDLSQYWYESGRIKDFTFRNNVMRGCSNLGEQSFIVAGVSGFSDAEAPKIHEKIEISNNRFEDIKHHAIVVGGVRDLVLRDNLFDRSGDDLIVIDGCSVVDP